MTKKLLCVLLPIAAQSVKGELMVLPFSERLNLSSSTRLDAERLTEGWETEGDFLNFFCYERRRQASWADL
jgi:hypothetical protein